MIKYNDSSKLLIASEKSLTPIVDKKTTAKTDLLSFTKQTKPNYRVNWHHETLATMLDRVAAGECRRLMVFMPPQHGKSELVSRRFPAYMLGRNPDLRLIAASHTHELAVAISAGRARRRAGCAGDVYPAAGRIAADEAMTPLRVGMVRVSFEARERPREPPSTAHRGRSMFIWRIWAEFIFNSAKEKIDDCSNCSRNMDYRAAEYRLEAEIHAVQGMAKQ